jgi:hypothetical protein
LDIPILLYRSEKLNLRKNIKKESTSIEMKFFRRTAGSTLVHHRMDEEILEQLKVESADEKLRRYKSN